MISTSGGARMYKGMLSLMQMAKTCGALAYHAQARLPYISVLTHPTTAGVMASYASVGDIIIAEPGAMIGFHRPARHQGHRQADPPGFQTAEFLLDHGLIDAIFRKEMKRRLMDYLSGFLAAAEKTAIAVSILVFSAGQRREFPREGKIAIRRHEPERAFMPLQLRY